MTDSIRAIINKLEGKVTEEDFLIQIGKEQERIRILDILPNSLDGETLERLREAIKS